MRRLIIVSLWGLAGCAGAQAARVEAEKALLDADTAFAKETLERGVEGWVGYFASDGQQVGPRTSEVGHAAIRAAMTPLFSDKARKLVWQPQSSRISADGTLGYTIGAYQLLALGPGGAESVLRKGRYLTVWRKQADGSFKVEADIGNVELPPKVVNQ